MNDPFTTPDIRWHTVNEVPAIGDNGYCHVLIVLEGDEDAAQVVEYHGEHSHHREQGFYAGDLTSEYGEGHRFEPGDIAAWAKIDYRLAKD